MSDKRQVSTDALATLGSTLDESAGRDAIHLAVEPVVAAHDLRPGEDVGFVGGLVGICDKPLGIVDPFLKKTVWRGERFWLIVYPRQITSLRHVWSHPAFKNKAESSSEQWIREFADKITVSDTYDEGGRVGLTYDELMNYAAGWLSTGEEPCLGSTDYQEHYRLFPEFWSHYQMVTGTHIPDDQKEVFFRCAC